MFTVAKRWKLGVVASPVEDATSPRVDSPEMSVVTEAEIGRLLAAYRQLEADPPEGTTAADWRLARRIVTVALGTGLRRGELLALRWLDVSLLEGKLAVREAFVRGQFQKPKSKRSTRVLELGTVTVDALDEQWRETAYQADGDLVFCHRQLGSPLDPSKLSRVYLRPALRKAATAKPFRVWHDLRHTALTHDAAAGNPAAYVQLKAGHSQGATTERYIHAAAVLFPGAADKAEARLFAGLVNREGGTMTVETTIRFGRPLPGVWVRCSRCSEDATIIHRGEKIVTLVDSGEGWEPVCEGCLVPGERIAHGERLLAGLEEEMDKVRREWLGADYDKRKTLSHDVAVAEHGPVPDRMRELCDLSWELEETLDDMRYVADAEAGLLRHAVTGEWREG
jgi:integrase